ncbi:UNVERIFIED_CONTAM: hypothetical protein Slati_0927500 [Sesamum latifolium]|uniref:Reverse transcriptase domain-containing protein n=1 Tax=Sesamum latifolium TaxID=2727402 RepID=A0AAW2XPS0_9LAMI
MGLEDSKLDLVQTLLVGFGGSEVASKGTIDLPVSIGEEPRRRTTMVRFLVVDTPIRIQRYPGASWAKLVYSSCIYLPPKDEIPNKKMVSVRFHATRRKQGDATICLCERANKKSELKEKGRKKLKEEKTKRPKMERIEPVEEHRSIELIAGQPDKVTRIGSSMSKSMETMMIEFLRKSVDLFAWSPSDFKGIDPEVIVHRLNVDPMMRPIKQK